jgi:hypothetical protein
MISPKDRTILRNLAQHVAEIANLPIQAERRELWKRHNSLQPVRPMLLVFPEGAWQELLPHDVLRCESEMTREIEWALCSRIYYHEHFQDDTVVEKEWVVSKVIHNSGWGLETKRIHSGYERGAWRFDPVIKKPTDLEKLRFPEITYDEKDTQRTFTEMQELFGDILRVKLKGMARISYHLMAQYTDWRGLEEVMIDMLANPGMLHEAMAFLTEGHQYILHQYVEQNLLSLNNDGTYHSSGGNGYTDELPQPDYDSERIRPCDMWASAESQEMAQVSPQMHAEFVTQYEKRLLEPFGLTGYGCCEDLSHKLDEVFTIPHIRRISISPFADVNISAERLKGDYIFSWKPKPTHLIGWFNEPLIRNYIRHTIKVAQANGCALEIILKDTHTCEHHPERFDRWLQIAREEITRAYT